jgi:hypothetical protein
MDWMIKFYKFLSIDKKTVPVIIKQGKEVLFEKVTFCR